MIIGRAQTTHDLRRAAEKKSRERKITGQTHFLPEQLHIVYVDNDLIVGGDTELLDKTVITTRKT